MRPQPSPRPRPTRPQPTRPEPHAPAHATRATAAKMAAAPAAKKASLAPEHGRFARPSFTAALPRWSPARSWTRRTPRRTSTSFARARSTSSRTCVPTPRDPAHHRTCDPPAHAALCAASRPLGGLRTDGCVCGGLRTVGCVCGGLRTVGCVAARAQINNVLAHGVRPVVAINRFKDDTDSELALLGQIARE
eukprot:2879137-Prymnesium_polylepis.1